jgi:ribonuclease HI
MKVYVDASMKEVCCVFGEPPITEIIALPEGVATHNEAEYLAIINGLYFAEDWEVEICSDSQLAVNQINKMVGGGGKTYKVKAPNLAPLALCVRFIVKLCEAQGMGVKFTWVPREENLAGKVLEKRA